MTSSKLYDLVTNLLTVTSDKKYWKPFPLKNATEFVILHSKHNYLEPVTNTFQGLRKYIKWIFLESLLDSNETGVNDVMKDLPAFLNITMVLFSCKLVGIYIRKTELFLY